MDDLVTPPFRVNQSDTHVYVEAQCPLTPANVSPEAVCEDTIFALRVPPYYLPWVEQWFRQGRVMRWMD